MKISNKLIKKYNIPVPRYTSYPPANYFKDNSNEDDYIQAIVESNTLLPDNISIYIHIPFCNKLCHFCGCNAEIKKKQSVIHNYVQAIKSEIKMLAEKISRNRKVSQIHYGGGTPNAIDVQFLIEINETIFREFKLLENAEIAIECNPACLDEEYVKGLKRAKFNRYSIGIQDFDEKILKVSNRDPSLLPIEDLLKLLRANGEIINLDFIYGLPGQTVESFSKVIKKAIKLRPERLVTFSYAHVPWVKKAQTVLEKYGLPTSEEKLKMFNAAYNLLTENGYKSIGLDHYALENDELCVALDNKQLHRNFQGYCTRKTTGQVYAVGISGITQLQNYYIQNTKSVDEYIESIKNGKFKIIKSYKLTENEIIIRDVINSFMCNNFVNLKQIGQKYNKTITEIKQIIGFDISKFEEFEKDGLITITDEEIVIDEDSILFIRNVASAFDPLMKNSKKSFSKSM